MPPLPCHILTVAGFLAIVITLVRGPNVGLSRRTGLIVGGVLLVVGVFLLVLASGQNGPVGGPG